MINHFLCHRDLCADGMYRRRDPDLSEHLRKATDCRKFGREKMDESRDADHGVEHISPKSIATILKALRGRV